MISEKIFLRFSHYMSMGAKDPWGMANLDLGLDWQDLRRGPINIATP